MSLESDLKEISGVGDATCKDILSILEDYQQDTSNVEAAYDELENGNKYEAKALLEQML